MLDNPEFDIEEMISEGYKSLADKALETYKVISNEIVEKDTQKDEHLIQLMTAYEEILEKLKNGSKIESLEREDLSTINEILRYFERTIPDSFKPQDPLQSLNTTIYTLKKYLGIKDIKEFMDITGITEFITSDNCKQPMMITTKIDYHLMKAFYSMFDPSKPSRSVISNINILYSHFLQEAFDMENIILNLEEIPNYRRLIESISTDEDLNNKMGMIISSTSRFYFLNLKEVEDFANEQQLDISELKKYLEENTPLVNFLDCYCNGESYIHEKDVIAKNPKIESDPTVKKIYEFLSINDCLLAPFIKYFGNLNRISIGICEYMNRHPEHKNKIKESSEFHKELTDRYFKPYVSSF